MSTNNNKQARRRKSQRFSEMSTLFETFDVILPLPYRIITYINIGLWLWLLTLKVSLKFGININLVLKFDNLNNLNFVSNHERSITNISIYSVLSYISYFVFHNDTVEGITFFDYIPLITMGYIFYALVNPNNVGSSRLFSTFKRILKGNISSELRTNDILLSDTLTSYSKSFIDLSLYLCHLFHNKTCLPKNSKSQLDRSCGESILLGSIIGFIPTLIRLSQCLLEYSRTKNATHIYNFLKYLTNFPIIVVGLFLQTNHELKKVWIFFSLLNSSYSFFWDINNDWDLNLFRQIIKNNYNNNILRLNLRYNVRAYYYLAILVDLILRFIWILKFLPVYEEATMLYQIISHLYTTELGLFVLQSLEIFRRWIWVFIKLEVEYINSNKDIEMEITK